MKRGLGKVFWIVLAIVLIVLALVFFENIRLSSVKDSEKTEVFLGPSGIGPATEVLIRWNPSSGTDYSVRSYPTPSLLIPTLVCDRVLGTECTEQLASLQLFFGNRLYYTVDACNTAGCSAESSSTVLDLNYPIPLQPTISNPIISGSNNLDLSWTNVIDEDYYRIERNGGNGFNFLTYIDADVTSYTDNSVVPGNSYIYRITAENVLTQNNGAVTSSSVNFDVPVAPTVLNADPSSTQIVLSWTDNSDNEVSFEVQRRITGSANNFVNIGSVLANGVSFIDTNVIVGETYDYEVFARNLVGDSAGIIVLQINVPSGIQVPNPPSGLTAVLN